MNNEHDDWFKGLEQDPFPARGFQPELKRRIMRELDKKPIKPKPHFRFGVMAGVCSLVICLLIILKVELFPAENPIANEMASSASLPVAELMAKKDVQSVLLVGLRQDGVDEQDQYRSLMFANQDGRVRAVATGSGVLIPYGQVFWKLDQAEDPQAEGKTLHIEQMGTKTTKTLVDPKTEKSTEGAAADAQPEEVRSEKLLYAGNKYLSLEVQDQRSNSTLWNVDLKDYATGIQPSDSSLNLDEFTDGRYFADMWTVVRQNGNWAPAYQSSLDLQSSTGKTTRTPYGITLTVGKPPLSDSLVNHDTLDRPWEEILKIEPAATDSVTSPDHDLLAIFTDSAIKLYEYTAKPGDEPLLTVSRNKGEQLVLVQWALEKYASKWIQAGQLALNEE